MAVTVVNANVTKTTRRTVCGRLAEGLSHLLMLLLHQG